MANRRVLGIIGSPRHGGNTDVLVGEVLHGAGAAGAKVERIYLDDYRINPCRSCYGCTSTNCCAQEDDMPRLLELMNESQIWVLGTPVYFSGPTGQMKVFMDRWFCKPSSIFQGRRAILVVPLGDDDPANARHTVGMFQGALAHQGVSIEAAIVAPGFGLGEKGPALGRADLLQTAYQTGFSCVS